MAWCVPGEPGESITPYWCEACTAQVSKNRTEPLPGRTAPVRQCRRNEAIEKHAPLTTQEGYFRRAPDPC